MRTLVTSLKRLFKNGEVSEEKIRSMYSSGTISKAEYIYITGKDPEA